MGFAAQPLVVWVLTIFLISPPFSSGQGPELSSTQLDLLREIQKAGSGGVALDPGTLRDMSRGERDKTEVGINYKIAGLTFESDIVLDKRQAQKILADIKANDKGRFKRKIVKDTRYRWGKKIKYAFGVNDGRWQNVIRNGLKHWEAHTCLRFQEVGFGSTGRDYINFVSRGGCYSNVGRIGGGQALSIGRGCDIKGIVAHEVGHALGLWHEQSRPDRDEFISINFGAIHPGTKSNFEKRRWSDTSHENQPYDLGSIMHYGSKAFAMRYDINTVQTKDRRFQETIGQRIGLTFVDTAIVNSAYCSSVCSGTRNTCTRGGYPDPNSCGKCKCPEGFGGSKCADPQRSTNCQGAGVLTATTTRKSIEMSGSNQLCNWVIRSQNCGRVLIELKNLRYQTIYPDSCSGFVEVKFKKDKRATGARFCRSVPAAIWSENEEVVIIHSTTETRTSGGFRLTYSSESSGGSCTVSERTKKPPKTTSSRGWGQWTSCSASCGGCGRRRRYRRDGTFEDQTCKKNPCPGTGRSVSKKCSIKLRVPCYIVSSLSRFDPRQASFAVESADKSGQWRKNLPQNTEATQHLRKRTGTLVNQEPIIMTDDGLLKPDLLVCKNGTVYILDLQVSSDANAGSLCAPYQVKVEKYSHPDVISFAAGWALDQTGAEEILVNTSAIVFSWRGALHNRSAVTMKSLGFSNAAINLLAVSLLENNIGMIKTYYRKVSQRKWTTVANG